MAVAKNEGSHIYSKSAVHVATWTTGLVVVGGGLYHGSLHGKLEPLEYQTLALASDI